MVKSVTIDKLPVTGTINDSDLLIVRSKEDGVTRQITKLQLFSELTEDVGDVLENYGTRSIVPALDGTYDLGSVNNTWRDLYIDGTLYAGTIVGGFDSSFTLDSNYIRGLIDSDLVLSLTAGVFDGIVTRLDADSNRLSASIEDITQLSLDLSALDSDFNGYQIATASALSNLSVRIDLDSNRLSTVASDVVSLNAQVSNLDLLGFDSSWVLGIVDSARASLRSELIARIDVTDSSLSILSGRFDSFSSELILLDSNVTANANAISNLFTRIDLTDNALSIISNDVTQLSADLSNLGSVDSAWILGIVDSARASVRSELIARIDLTDNSVSVLTERVDSLSSSLILLDSSLRLNATAINTLGTRVSATESNYSILSQDLVELSQTVDGLVIDGINSDLVITVINEQTAGLIGRIDADSNNLVSLSSDFTLLENNVVLKDSFNTTLLAANAYNSLDTRITANSDGVTTLSQRVTDLENTVGYDSDTFVSSTAYQALTSKIEANDSDILVNSGLITDLQGSIGFDSDGFVSSNAYQSLTSSIQSNSDGVSTLAQRIDSLETIVGFDSDVLVSSTAYQSLTSRINAVDDSVIALSGLITDLQNSIGFDSDALVSSTAYQALTSSIQAVDDSVTAQASLINNLSVSIQNLEDSVTNTASLASGFDVRITEAEGEITDIASEYFLTTNVNGYISGIKLTNTGDSSEFIVQTDRFKIVNSITSEDVLLLSFDSDAPGTFTLDESLSSQSVTLSNGAGSSTNKKYGSTSLYVPISTNGRVDITHSSSLNLGTDDFSIEFWYRAAYTATAGSNYVLTKGSTVATNNGWSIAIGQFGSLGFYWGNGTSTKSYRSLNNVISSDVWTHVAVTRIGSDIRLWVNGQQVTSLNASFTDSIFEDLSTTENLVIGRSRGGSLSVNDFRMDELRITKGISRYKENFVPPLTGVQRDQGIEFTPFVVSNNEVTMKDVRVTGDLMVDGTITTNKLTFNADGANLVTDVASFENYASLGFVYGTPGNSTHTITNEIPAVHGTHVLKLNTTASNGFKYIHPSTDTARSWIRAEVGEQYIVSGYVRTKSTDTVPVRLVAIARAFGTTSGGTPTTVSRDITASDGWVRISGITSEISGDITDPAFALFVRNANNGDSSYWDAIQIEKYDGLHTNPSPFKLAGTTTIDGSSITTGTISADRIDTTNLVVSSQIADFITGDSVDDNVVNPPNFNLNKSTSTGRTYVTPDGIKIQSSADGVNYVTRVKLGNLSVL